MLTKSIVIATLTLAVACAAARIADDGQSSQSTEVPEFIPTSEWQTVLPGQAIPPGLHVRMNLETGERTAKLVSPNDSDDESIRSVVVDAAESSTAVTIKPDEKVANGNDDLNNGARNQAEAQKKPNENEESVIEMNDDPHRFGSGSSEYKQTFGSHPNMSLIQSILIALASTNTSTSDIHDNLETLEDLVHDFEYANDFVAFNGLEIVSSLLRIDSETVDHSPLSVLEDKNSLTTQYWAAWVLGTANQNNKPVREATLSSNTLSLVHTLLQKSTERYERLVKTATDSNQVFTDQPDLAISTLKMQGKLVYALSSILRNFLPGQSQAINLNLVDSLIDLAQQIIRLSPLSSSSSSFETTINEKLENERRKVLLKILAFLVDMVTDHVPHRNPNQKIPTIPKLVERLVSPSMCSFITDQFPTLDRRAKLNLSDKDTRISSLALELLYQVILTGNASNNNGEETEEETTRGCLQAWMKNCPTSSDHKQQLISEQTAQLHVRRDLAPEDIHARMNQLLEILKCDN